MEDEMISLLKAQKKLNSKSENEWVKEGRDYLRETGLFDDKDIDGAWVGAHICIKNPDAKKKRFLVVNGLSCGETGKLIDRSRNSVQGSCRLGSVENYWTRFMFERIIPLEEVVRLRKEALAREERRNSR